MLCWDWLACSFPTGASWESEDVLLDESKPPQLWMLTLHTSVSRVGLMGVCVNVYVPESVCVCVCTSVFVRLCVCVFVDVCE